MDTTRRALLLGAAAAGLVAWNARDGRADEGDPAPQPADGEKAATPMKILMLGGTAFLGPELVEEATSRGHTVTLFNRGKTNPHLFPDLEKLRGDRNGDVSALDGRTFDAVFDTSAYVPAQVKRIADVLGDRVGHYGMVSTISVYPEMGTSDAEITEETPVGRLDDPTVEKVTGETYGPLKALCEEAAEAAWPGRVANVRPGLIVGPGDPTDRFTYWPARVARGGDVLAPGDGTDEAQAIDVRDLAAFLMHCAEQKVAGVYNAVGYEGKVTFAEMLHGAKCALRHDVQFHWADAAFLEAQGVRAWHNLPLWLPPGSNPHCANERARAKGLAFRPLAQTIADTVAWMRETNRAPTWGEGRTPGLSAAREAEVLAALKAR